MNQTFDLSERAKQKEMLRRYYADYDPKRHDAFVIRFTREVEEKALEQYHERRGITGSPVNICWHAERQFAIVPQRLRT
jgi:hypothetical protein